MTPGREYTFHKIATAGTAIATASLERVQLGSTIRHINHRFGLSIAASDEVYEFLVDQLRFVAGRYWQERDAVDRKSVLDRLEKLERHAKGVVEQLKPLRPGMHEEADVQLVNFLTRTVDLAHAGKLDRPRQQLETILQVSERLESYCEQALVVLAQIPGKKGQRGIPWYDDFVQLMTDVAGRLGIKVTTAGDRRADDPYATPFTVLVYEVEKALPEGARSNLLSACAKRIERSMQSTRRARRKASKS